MDLDVFLVTVRASTLINHLFHFTDEKNLASIRERGLLSARELRRLNIFETVVTGGDAASLETDIQKGNDQYVCLCFTKAHPMCHVARQRGVKAGWLWINPAIIKVADVMVTDAPCNQNGVVPQAASTALDGLHLDAIYEYTDWSKPEVYARRKVAEKYEILVPNKVAVDYILAGL